MQTTRRDLHEFVESLPDDDVETVARVLEALVQTRGRIDWVAPKHSLASPENDGCDLPVAEKPPIMSVDQLRGDFWPDDEEPDDFELAVRAWRESDLDGRYRR